MSARDRLLVSAAVVLLLVATSFALGGFGAEAAGTPSEPTPAADLAQDDPSEEPEHRPVGISPSASLDDVPHDPTLAPVTSAAAAPRDDELHAPPERAIHGAVRVLSRPNDRPKDGLVVISRRDGDELVPVRRQRVGFYKGLGGYFEFDDLPVDDGEEYHVEIFAERYNGSVATVRTRPGKPIADVELSVTPGVPVTLRLVDQDREPHRETWLDLVPDGPPTDRTRLRAQTDAFGSVSLPSVTRGRYGLYLTDLLPTAEEPITTIDVPTWRRGAPLTENVFTHVQEVPVGPSLQVEIIDVGNFGVADANVELTWIDSTANHRYEQTTDVGGYTTFEHLRPGRYRIAAWSERHERRTRTFDVAAASSPDPQRYRIRLFPQR